MALAALVAYAVWIVLAFGVRTLVAVKRTGDSGWRGVAGTRGTAAWWAGALLVSALVLGGAAPVADLLGMSRLLDSTVVASIGVSLAVIGIMLTLLAQLSMGASWRIGCDPTERTELVTTGAFAVVRNPIYSAMLVTATGLTLMVRNALAVVALVVLVAAIELQVRRVEEPHLRTVHGAAYAGYTRRVGRFVPRLLTAY